MLITLDEIRSESLKKAYKVTPLEVKIQDKIHIQTEMAEAEAI